MQKPPTYLGRQVQPPPRKRGGKASPRDQQVEEHPSGLKFFSQFKSIIEHKPDEKLTKLMSTSQTMQATRMAKQRDNIPLSSYTSLHTAPVTNFQPSKPYSETHRTRKMRQHGGVRDPASELYHRC